MSWVNSVLRQFLPNGLSSLWNCRSDSLFLGLFLRARARKRIVVGTGLRNRRKKTTSPVPMRREEQRRNRKVKGMFWASLHFSSTHLLSSPTNIHYSFKEPLAKSWKMWKTKEKTIPFPPPQISFKEMAVERMMSSPGARSWFHRLISF